MYLDKDVAKIKFEKAVLEINEKSATYENLWKLRKASFPTIIIDVFDENQKPFVVLSINLSNWNFLPPFVDLLVPNLSRLIAPLDLGINDSNYNPASHLVFDPMKNRYWFCLPGFEDYHNKYWDDRWEKLRNTSQGEIVSLIEYAYNAINDRIKK